MASNLDNLLAIPGFKEKLAQICNALGCKPSHLLMVMGSESDFLPWARNRNGDASGLIQFMPDTARSMFNLSTEQIRAMPAVQQLDLVYRFYLPHKGKLSTPGALYAVTYLPGRFSTPMTPNMVDLSRAKPFPTNSPVLSAEFDITKRKNKRGERVIPNTDYYTSNRPLDQDRDGYVTVADLDKRLEKIARRYNITDDILSQVRPSTTPLTNPPTQSGQPTTPTETLGDDYIEKVYKSPFRNGPANVREEMLLKDTEARKYFFDYLSKLRGPDYSRKDLEIPYINAVALQPSMLDGDLELINGITQQQQKRDDEIKSILGDKLKSFSPDAKSALLTHGIFEVYPDSMRNKMSKNSTFGGNNPNFSHAWRLPNKLSVTADMTIPGVSGLRVGQIFWVDKLGDSYKEYGAFQLFGLSENIDVSRGWTTSIHSRFIALPKRGGQKYLTDKVNDGTTSQQSKEGKPQN